MFINAIYSFYWDVAMDWSLELFRFKSHQQQNKKNKYLRAHITFHKEFYYIGILVDLVLRFAFPIRYVYWYSFPASMSSGATRGTTPVPNALSFWNNGVKVDMGLRVFEVFRRFMWVVFRIERECIYIRHPYEMVELAES